MRYGVVGFFDYQSGLAVAARNTATALRNSGREVELIRANVDGSVEIDARTAGALDIALLHANPWPGFVPRIWSEAGSLFDPWSQVNACAPFFELPAVPLAWLRPLAGMDVLIAPTRHVADALERDVASARTIYVPQTALLPDGVCANRQRFGLPLSAFVFVTSFDAGSDVARKNPWAAIEAFQRAFPQDNGVALAVRTRLGSPEALGALERRLLQFASHDRRVVLVKGDMDYPSVLTLYASGDAYVSLHRAEGLGLGPMEAMSLGLPVIATGWSGNMDFMSQSNSLPVKYRLVDVEVSEDSAFHGLVLPEDARWAEPDIDSAAVLMARVRNEKGLATNIGNQARADMDKRRARFLSGVDFAGVEALAAPPFLKSKGHLQRASILAASVRSYRRAVARANLREWAKTQGRRVLRPFRG